MVASSENRGWVTVRRQMSMFRASKWAVEVVQVSGTGESLILGLQKGPQDGSEEEAIAASKRRQSIFPASTHNGWLGLNS